MVLLLSSHSNTCLVACYFHEVCFLQTVSIVNQWVARNRTNYISKSFYKLWSSCLYAMCQLKCDIYWCHSFLLLMLLLWLEYMHTKRFMISTCPNKGNNRHYVRKHLRIYRYVWPEFEKSKHLDFKSHCNFKITEAILISWMAKCSLQTSQNLATPLLRNASYLN